MFWKRRKEEDGAWRWPNWFFPALIGLALLKLWLVASQPILAIGIGSDLDDRLFLNLAQSLLRGQWLGSYSVFTLAKGCFYPIWIALVSRMSIPLLLSQHLLYLAAVVVLVFAIKPALPRPGFLLLLFSVLWFNPGTYSLHVLRVMREGIYPALTLFVVAGAIGILVRFDGPARILWRWLLGTGVALAAFWQTREEGMWLLPLYALVVGWALVKLWRSHHPRKWSRALMCVVPLAIMVSANLVVSGINQAKYGIFATVEFKAPEFLAAYGALNRVKPKPWQPHVLVTKETRERIYVVSPAFAELRPLLEGAVGKSWGDGTRGLWPELKAGEIGGGNFMWALREAVSRAGYHSSGTRAMAYYGRVAREIDAACTEGKLECLPARASMMAPWRQQFNRPFLETMAKAVPFFSSFAGIAASLAPSRGSQESLALFRDITHDRLAPIGRLAGSGTAGINAFKIGILQAGVTVFQGTMPILAVLALVAFFLKMVHDLKQRAPSDFLMIQMALLGSIFTRLTILSIIEVTAFPGIDPLYLSSAYPLLIAFTFLALGEGATLMILWLRRRSVP
jgi:hypothetical protein